MVASLFTTRRLITRLTQSPVRTKWYALLVLIVLFILGYLGYAWAFQANHSHLLDLIVPFVFFFGACFVWLTTSLSLQTAVDVLRINLLEQENTVDPLTGVFNRRFLERHLNEEVTRARKYLLPLSIILIDVDHFKLINDSYGHQVGDQVLASFANLLKRQLREPDILARYGGEEFMVVAPQTSHQNAVELAERLRMRIEANNFYLTNAQDGTQPVHLTCSAGVASLEGELDCLEKLVHLADDNLYRAKSAGRNRVFAD